MASISNQPIPGNLNAARLSDITVDGMPLKALTPALVQGTPTTPAQKSAPTNQFWSSPRRMILDPNQDVFEVRYNSAHYVNGIAFEISAFPFRAALQYYEASGPLGVAAWLPCLTLDGSPTVITNSTSLPSVIATQVIQQTKVHPFHHGNGHWLKENLRIQPVSSSRFRLVFTRPFGTPPVDRQKTPLAYPIAVRKWNATFKVRAKGDAPKKPKHPHYPTWQQPIDSTADIMGSGRAYSLRENLANDLLSGGIWKSEPQPVPNAVVNLYVDLRDAQNMPAVTDRLYMDPLYSGTNVNLYYSTDDPTGDFPAQSLPQGVIGGTGAVSQDASGLVFADAPAWVDVDNSMLHFDPTQPWWIGLLIQPQFDSNDTNTYQVFDFGDATLSVTEGVWQAALITATADVPTTFATNQVISLVVSYDGEGTNALSILASAGLTDEGTATVTLLGTIYADGPPDLLRFFGSQTNSALAGNVRLLDMMLKVGIPTVDDFMAFAGDEPDLDAYIDDDEFESGVVQSTDNALLRFTDEQIVPVVNPTGFIGGPGNLYSTLTWTPVNRDFKAAKAYFEYPAIKATFLNLEFTNLAAETYETYQTIYRTVQTFTGTPVVEFSAIQTGNYTAEPGGLKTNNDISQQASTQFGDFANLLPPSLPLPGTGYTRTEAYYTPDPTLYNTIRSANPLYGMQPWKQEATAPTQIAQGVHIYAYSDMEHVTRTAYFCGLNQLLVYRTEYEALDDTRQYDELFHDDHNIAVNNGWGLQDNDANTGFNGTFTPVSDRSITSNVFTSECQVIGLQFATSQTPPIQLLPDPDFNTFNADGTQNLDQWDVVGDGTFAPSTSFNSSLGTTVEVTRTQAGTVYFGQSTSATTSDGGNTPAEIFNPEDHVWGALEVLFANWTALEVDTWGTLEGVSFTPGTGTPTNYTPGQVIGTPLVGGIRSKGYVTPTGTGRIYAAARVIATQALQVPLWLQVISDKTNADGSSIVLSEEPLIIPSGAISEWFVGYTIGTGAGSDDRIAVRVIQKYATGDIWFVDNISIFEDPIVWEFSNDGGQNFYPVYDIRNDPNGVFIFPPSPIINPGPEVGTSLVWRVSADLTDMHVNSLHIRPWYDRYRGPIPPREIVQRSGGQMSDYDNYPPIEFAPPWRMWHKPVPIDWWFFYRQWLALSGNPILLPPVGEVFLIDGMLVNEIQVPTVWLGDTLVT